MLNVGASELFVILLVALLVLGPDKLPNAARQMGRAMGELRRLSSGFQAEVRDAFQEPVASRPATSSPPVGPASDPEGVTARSHAVADSLPEDAVPDDVPPDPLATTDPTDLLPEDDRPAGLQDDLLPEDREDGPTATEEDEVGPGDGVAGGVPPA